ncbi:endo alpha-1,4 polygalactosaminidase [Treponema sp.]|uniref:endo alpha-1,4 polygalactosaminidase n=1 Tax=Treponema sp. TaxID=166 RepID=UPI0025E25C9C|nr:endo alpha-1,4 polygalactosaminidase [Treponema sp.]MCR5218564.1 endo alpha-1,4 polygalactosaminidase [Treponema sp.]
MNKKLIFSIIMGSLVFLSFSCSTGSSQSNSSDNNVSEDSLTCDNYRAAMRNFVIKISETARQSDSDFIVIPQNGQNVAWDDDDADSIVPDSAYFAAINGCGREDAFYGMNASYDIADGTATPDEQSQEIQELCDYYTAAGLTVLSTDYTGSDQSKITDSFAKNADKGYLSFAATERSLNVIPSYSVYNQNTDDVTSLSDAKNFLYIINPENYDSKEAFVSALADTDYDAIIMDLYCCDEALTSSDIEAIRNKKSGGKRLLICYMSIGEAETYRWYWQSDWKSGSPSFICEENTDWEGNYKVRYWYDSWQNIICGEDGYLSKIQEAGFDGVYLDIIDAFEYFEEE